MNAMILLAQGAMNMADSLATANPVLTEVNAPEMNMLDMAIKGGWIMIVLGVLSVVCFYILFERNYMIRKAGKEDPMFMERIKDYTLSIAFKTAIIITPTSAKMANHIFAIPTALKARQPNSTISARTIFCGLESTVPTASQRCASVQNSYIISLSS